MQEGFLVDQVVALKIELNKIRCRLITNCLIMSVSSFFIHKLMPYMIKRAENRHYWIIEYLFYILTCLVIFYDAANCRRLRKSITQYEKRLV
jgi:hypothetical protein